MVDYMVYIVEVINLSEKQPFRYTGNPYNAGRPIKPRSIAIDSQSNTLIADCNNHCNHIIHEDEQFPVTFKTVIQSFHEVFVWTSLATFL
jgi:hypothetical protein